MEREVELQSARDNAWSFPGIKPPDGADYIGSEIRGKEEYMYYKTNDGKYFFETKSGYEFKEYMEKVQKKKTNKKH